MSSERVVMKAQDPPPEPTRHDWVAAAKKLRKAPDKWFLVIEQCKVSTIQAIRQGSVRALDPAMGFEVRQASTSVGSDGRKRADLYLRFAGKSDG